MTDRGSPRHHAAVWAVIDELAGQAGMSRSRLAMHCGCCLTTFNPCKRIDRDGRLRWPSVETITAALAVTSTSYAQFGVYLDAMLVSMEHTGRLAA